MAEWSDHIGDAIAKADTHGQAAIRAVLEERDEAWRALGEIEQRLRPFPSFYPGYGMIQRVADRARDARPPAPAPVKR